MFANQKIYATKRAGLHQGSWPAKVLLVALAAIVVAVLAAKGLLKLQPELETDGQTPLVMMGP